MNYFFILFVILFLSSCSTSNYEPDSLSENEGNSEIEKQVLDDNYGEKTVLEVNNDIYGNEESVEEVSNKTSTPQNSVQDSTPQNSVQDSTPQNSVQDSTPQNSAPSEVNTNTTINTVKQKPTNTIITPRITNTIQNSAPQNSGY